MPFLAEGRNPWSANGAFAGRGINAVQILSSSDGVNYTIDVGSTFNTNGALVNEVLFDGTLPVPELDGTAALAPLSLLCFGLLH